MLVYKNKSDSDLVCGIQLISIEGRKLPTHTTQIFNLQGLLIAVAKPDMSQKYIFHARDPSMILIEKKGMFT